MEFGILAMFYNHPLQFQKPFCHSQMKTRPRYSLLNSAVLKLFGLGTSLCS